MPFPVRPAQTDPQDTRAGGLGAEASADTQGVRPGRDMGGGDTQLCLWLWKVPLKGPQLALT